MATNRGLDALNRDQLSSIFRQLDQHVKIKLNLKTQAERADHFKVHPSTYNRLLKDNEKMSTSNLRDKTATMVGQLGVEWEVVSEREVRIQYPTASGATNLNDWRASDQENTLDYIFYYVDNQRVNENFTYQKAHLIINLAEKRAILKFYLAPTNGKAGSSSTDLVPRFTYHGTLSSTVQNTYLLFDRRISGNEVIDVPAMIVLNVSSSSLRNSELLLASFSTTGPACGIGVLQLCGAATAVERILDPTTDPVISLFLVGKSYSLERNQSTLFDTERCRRIVSQVRARHGQYLAFLLNYYGNQVGIAILKLRIFAGYRIAYKGLNDAFETHGYILAVVNEALIGRLNYNTNQDTFTTFLNVRPLTYGNQEEVPDNTLAGVFGGIRTYDAIPEAHRIMLVPIDQDTYNASKARYIQFNDSHSLKQLFEERPYLQAFFTGYYDRFIDSPLMHPENVLLKYRQHRQSYTNQIAPIAIYAGWYLTYRLSSRGGTVYQRVIEISKETGIAQRFIKLQDDYQLKLSGRVRLVRDSVLSIHFDQRVVINVPDATTNMDTSRTTNIYMGAYGRSDRRFLEGQTNLLSNDRYPMSAREFFERIPEPTNEAELQDLLQDWRTGQLPEDPERAELVRYLLENKEDHLMVSKGYSSD